jgi:hypothetical protein
MSQGNRIDIQISAEDHAKIQRYVNGLNETLMPYLQTLTTQDRKELPKLGDKSIAFVNKTREYMERDKDLVPVFLDTALFTHDVESYAQLAVYQRQLAAVVTALDDSMMLSGSEAYSSALLFYHHAKMLAMNGVTKAKSVYEDLATRFPGSRRRNTAEAKAE